MCRMVLKLGDGSIHPATLTASIVIVTVNTTMFNNVLYSVFVCNQLNSYMYLIFNY